MEFPRRIYTSEEVARARELIDKGYKHRITIKGSSQFKRKVKRALFLVRTAGYYDYLRTYIRRIEEIDGLTQLRNADAAIWTNKYAVENTVDAASMFVQKANIMKEYVELVHYYSGQAEKRSVQKRVEFLKSLKDMSREEEVIEECDRLLQFWRESSLAY